MPAVDRAEAFGQHPNADIAYQIEDSWLVLESLLSLQPQTALAAGGRSREDTVAAICADLLEQVLILMTLNMALLTCIPCALSWRKLLPVLLCALQARVLAWGS